MTHEINTPWKVDGLHHVLVKYEAFDSMLDLHRRAQKFIAYHGGVREDGQWPEVPIALYDIPEENIYHYAEFPIGEGERMSLVGAPA